MQTVAIFQVLLPSAPMGTEEWDIYVYNYNSNPAKQDTDGDGLLDGKSVTIECDDPLNREIVVAPKDNQPKTKNGDAKVWDYYKKIQKSGWTQVYYSGDDGLKVGVEQSIADKIVNLLLENRDSLSSAGYSLRECILGFKNIIEGDTVLGAYLLNFIYDNKGVAYHSQPETWQREFGYNDFYDEVFDFGSYMNKGRYIFNNNGIDYALWMWKGDYWNLQSGAEIGLYIYDRSVGDNEQYDAIDFEIPMELSLFNQYSNGDIDCLFNWKPGVRQWWITGFNPRFKDADPERMTSIGKLNLVDNKDLYLAMKDGWDKGENYDQISQNNLIFDDENYCVWVCFW